MVDDFAKLRERNIKFAKENKDYEKLTGGQQPKYVVIACSDSRVAPEIVMNCALGELFTIRVAGNVIDTAALGSIEYAVEHLGVRNIVMMPHTKCGAVTAAQSMLRENDCMGDNTKRKGDLDELVRKICVNISDNEENKENLTRAVINNAIAQIRSIMKSPLISKAIKSGLKIELLLYNIETGTLEEI